MRGEHRSLSRIVALFESAKRGRHELVLSTVNLSEVVRHTAVQTKHTGVDAETLLRSYRVHLHRPDEAVARRVARLPTSLADGFAAGTALELGARLHTTDHELVRQLKASRLSITVY